MFKHWRFAIPALAANVLLALPQGTFAQSARPSGTTQGPGTPNPMSATPAQVGTAPVGAPGTGGTIATTPGPQGGPVSVGSAGTGGLSPANPNAAGMSHMQPGFGIGSRPFNRFGFGFPGFGLGGFLPFLGGGFNFSGSNFTNLAATAGWSAGQAAGSSFASSLTNELFTYAAYLAHGYGTGRPQYYPNPGMMAIIAGSPVPTVGASGAAVLRINAPKEAKVWVNGNALKWSDKGWFYQSPAIGANDIRSASVRAKWGSDPYEVTRTADLILRPGDQKSVTFFSGEGAP